MKEVIEALKGLLSHDLYDDDDYNHDNHFAGQTGSLKSAIEKAKQVLSKYENQPEEICGIRGWVNGSKELPAKEDRYFVEELIGGEYGITLFTPGNEEDIEDMRKCKWMDETPITK
jgi:hypothetical protein